MRLTVIAVGTRLPAWAEAAFADYARRMPRSLPLRVTEIRAEPREGGRPLPAVLAAEAARIRAVLPARARLVVLDERGADLSTPQLAARLKAWQEGGEEVALILGGPDGLAAELRAEAAETLRLSSLTLPHALARVVLAEALYRAASLLQNHPYHRA